MPAFLLLLYRFIRSIWLGLKDPDFRALFLWVVGLLALGTWFYNLVEGWDVLDALYFSVVTLTTVGYGDFTPKTVEGKLFTIFYILIGLGLVSGFVLLMADKAGFLRHKDHEKTTDESNDINKNK